MRRTTAVVIGSILAAILVATPGALAASRDDAMSTYDYEITMTGSGTGDVQATGPSVPTYLTFSGTLSTSFRITYKVRFQVYRSQKSIALFPIDPTSTTYWASSISGTSSLDLTASCAGPPCTGQPNHCSYSGIQLSPSTMNANWESDAGPDYGDGHKAYLAGKVRFSIMSGWRGGVVGSCALDTGGTGISPPTIAALNDDLVGISWIFCNNFLDIPVAQLGRPTISVPDEGDPTGCKTDLWDVPYTAHVQRTTTMRLLNPQTEVHVGKARASTSERLKRLASELKPRIQSLIQQKQKVDASLAGLRSSIDGARAAVDAVGGQLAPLGVQVDQTQSFIRQIAQAQDASPDRPVAQARDSLDQAMARVQVQIVEAYLAGDTGKAHTLEARFASDERQLNNLNASLRGKEAAADGLRTKWLDRLRTLEGRVFSLQRDQAQKERALWDANSALQQALGTSASLESDLVDAAAQLASLDFSLKSVTVTADGKKVFEAELTGPEQKLADLDKQIAELKQILAQLDTKRQASKETFVAAEKESIAALSAVADTIMAVAYKKAGVDLAFNAYDIVRAGSKGGLIGAFAEALKKGAEGLYAYMRDTDTGGAKELDDAYLTKMKDAFGASKIGEIALQRLGKDTISKPLKDKVSQKWLSQLFEHVYGLQLLPDASEAAPAQASLAARLRTFIASFSDKEAHLVELKKGITTPWSSLKNAGKVGSDLVGKFLEDVAKNLAKAYFDSQEQEAWAAYFEKEVAARMYFPMWQLASEKYWAAYDELNHLLDQKAEALKGYDAQTKSKTILDEKFPSDAKLVITVQVERPGGTTGTVDLAVTLGGKPATQASGYSYTIDASSLKEGPGGLGLEVAAQ